SQKNASRNLMDSEIREGELKVCSDKGCDKDKEVDENADKGRNNNVDNMKFGSVNEDMLTRNKGSNNLKLPTVSNINLTPSANSKMSYASVANKLESLIDNKLMTVPTDIDEFGNEFVVFDEELINDGSRRWQLTLCGFFVGFKMRINELRYNVRRMWSRYGLKEVIENDCCMVFFKFHHEEGMNYVVDNGPWMILQPPLEALTVKGISAIASRIGKPLIMDLRTASMCNQSVGRIGYARVLIEVLAKKGLPHKIDLVYKNAAKEIIGQKTVKVIYDWAPCVCSECGVFGHNVKMCHKSTDAVNEDQPNVACKVQKGKQPHDEFTEVVNKKIGKQNNNKSKNNQAQQCEKENNATQEGIKKVSDDIPKKGNLDGEGELYEVEDTIVEMEDVYSMNDGMARDMNEGDLKGMDENVL
ncbi:RNA-directed DNA polymerase, eukaryota, reverse transcriptase zinc-binding domain protein, partial [Tanacetum coccineum]